MPEIQINEKKIIVKIVCYGPALSGKTTNLMQLHEIINPDYCSDLMTFETKKDRTLFFDLLPVMVTSEFGYKLKIKFYTVPGQVAHDATRKAVLSRSDGIIFVADSQTHQSMNNFESFENLEKNAYRVGLNFDKLPLVIQFNKRDLKDIISEEEIKNRWQPTNIPVIFSSAIFGKGVKETFLNILQQTYIKLNKEIKLQSDFGIGWDNFKSLIHREV